MAALAANAARNGVPVEPRGRRRPARARRGGDRSRRVHAGARRRGAAAGRTSGRGRGSPPCAATATGVVLELAGGERLRARAARQLRGPARRRGRGMAGDAPFAIYPRKGEFLVFERPPARLREILLPVPTAAGQGRARVPDRGRSQIAGPTARRPRGQGRLVRAPRAADGSSTRAEHAPAAHGRRARRRLRRPAPRRAWRQLRRSRAPRHPGLVNAAAIRSTGLSAAPASPSACADAGRSRGDRARRAARRSRRRRRVPVHERPRPRWQLAAGRSRAPGVTRAAAPRHRRGHDRGQGGAVRPATCSPLAEARRPIASRTRSRAGSSRTARTCWRGRRGGRPRCSRRAAARSPPAASTTRASR